MNNILPFGAPCPKCGRMGLGGRYEPEITERAHQGVVEAAKVQRNLTFSCGLGFLTKGPHEEHLIRTCECEHVFWTRAADYPEAYGNPKLFSPEWFHDAFKDANDRLGEDFAQLVDNIPQPEAPVPIVSGLWNGWHFAYSDVTRFVGAEHENGKGKFSVCEVVAPGAAFRVAVGEAVADMLNKDVNGGVMAVESGTELDKAAVEPVETETEPKEPGTIKSFKTDEMLEVLSLLADSRGIWATGVAKRPVQHLRRIPEEVIAFVVGKMLDPEVRARILKEATVYEY